ncbi:MAG: flagellar hook assembly protein FlgD [Pseudomonadota bacterium]
MVDSVSSTPGLGTFEANQRAADEAAAREQDDADELSSDYEDFLLLMTTQMQNQDPLEPMDSTEFVSQLAQFSGVEQQVNMNSKLDELISSFNNGQFDEAALYLGKVITAPTGNFTADSANLPQIEYTTPDDTVSASIEIFDQFDQRVRTIPAEIASTAKSVEWDMTDALGDAVDNGVYRAEIVSTNFNGEITRENALTKNRVTEVIKLENGFDLKTETGDRISLDEVTRLGEYIPPDNSIIDTSNLAS